MNATKRFSWQIGAVILLAMAALGTSLQAASISVDPIVGNWVWHGREQVTFKADGTVHHSHGSNGTWEYLHNPEAQRHYRIVWEHGKDTDEVVCSEDGLSAHIRNVAAKKQFDAHRSAPDKPAPTDSPNKPGDYFGTRGY